MNDKHCDAFRELASAALDGQLDAGEAARLEKHLGDCPACRGARDAFARQREGLLASAIPPVAEGVARRLQDALRPARRRFAVSPRLRRAAVLVAVVGLTSWVVDLMSRPATGVSEPASSMTAEGEPRGLPEESALDDKQKLSGGLAAEHSRDGAPMGGEPKQDARGAGKESAPPGPLRRQLSPAPGAPSLTRAYTLPRRLTDDGLAVRVTGEKFLIQQKNLVESIPQGFSPQRTLSERDLMRCDAAVTSAARSFATFVADARSALAEIEGAEKPGKSLVVESLDSDTSTKKAPLVAKRVAQQPTQPHSEARRLYVAEGPSAILAVRGLLVQRPEPLQTLDTALLAAAGKGRLEWSGNSILPRSPQTWEVFILPPAQRVADEILGAIESLADVHLRAAEGNPDVGESVIVVLDH